MEKLRVKDCPRCISPEANSHVSDSLRHDPERKRQETWRQGGKSGEETKNVCDLRPMFPVA